VHGLRQGGGDLAARAPTSGDHIGSWIRTDHPKLRNSGTGGPSLWNFYAEMKEGDLVIASGKAFRGVFEVTGPYEYRDEGSWQFGYAHVRAARLTELDARSLWEACNRHVGVGQSIQWSVARCDVTPAAQSLISAWEAKAGSMGRTDMPLPPSAHPQRPDDWSEWANQRESAFSDWQSAGAGLARVFADLNDDTRAPRQRIAVIGAAYWVLIGLPLPGVHLIAFQLDPGDLRTKVSLRIWVNDQYPEIYQRFSLAAPFRMPPGSVSRTKDVPPRSSFKSELSSREISITGVLHSVELDRLGAPGPGVLSSLFEEFCAYAIACYRGEQAAAEAGAGSIARNHPGVSQVSYPWRMAAVFVTGATGYMGSRLCRELSTRLLILRRRKSG